MTQPDSPRQPEDGPEPPDPLESLSERVRHAQEAAERLVREANAEAQRAADEGDGPASAAPRLRGAERRGRPLDDGRPAGARRPARPGTRPRPARAARAARRSWCARSAARRGRWSTGTSSASTRGARRRSRSRTSRSPSRPPGGGARTIGGRWPNPQPGSSPARPRTTPPRASTASRVIGLKERRRNFALQIEPGDRIVLYLTKVMAFAGLDPRDRRAVRGPHEALARQARQGRRLPVALPHRARARARRGRVGARRGARGRARAHPQVARRALDARLPGPDPRRLRARRGAAARAHGRRGPRARHERGGSGSGRAVGGVRRLRAAWRALAPEQRLAAFAAFGLLVTMFLPWYSTTSAGKSASGSGRSRQPERHRRPSRGSRPPCCSSRSACSRCCSRARSGGPSTCPAATAPSSPAAGLWACLLIVWRLLRQARAGQRRERRPAVGHLRRAVRRGRAWSSPGTGSARRTVPSPRWRRPSRRRHLRARPSPCASPTTGRISRRRA